MKFLWISLCGLLFLSCGKSNASNGKKSWYIPDANSSWHWQLNGKIKMDVLADVYIVDLYDTPKSTIDTLHKEGKKVIAYFSAGSYESWREDAKRFSKSAIGAKMDGWDERWLDIRDPSIKSIMRDRIALAKKKGFDGVEADNVDGYTNKTGFKLSFNDQIKYNRFLSEEAHKNSLAIALKNDIDQIKDLEKYFDFAINEECHEFNECDKYQPFIKSKKAVFNAEYKKTNTKKVCLESKKLGLQTLFLPLELDGSFRIECK